MLDNLLIVWKTCAWITIFSNYDTKPCLHFDEYYLIFFKKPFSQICNYWIDVLTGYVY